MLVQSSRDIAGSIRLFVLSRKTVDLGSPCVKAGRVGVWAVGAAIRRIAMAQGCNVRREMDDVC